MSNVAEIRTNGNTPRTRIRLERNVQDETIDAFYDNLKERAEMHWNNDWGHPYFWPWPDDHFREKVIHQLCATDGRQTDYAAKDLLRFLLYSFGAAQRHRKTQMGNGFSVHRWRWFFNEEITQATGLNRDQIQRAGNRLEERGLIVRCTDNRLGYVPHYRPTTDLFRACSYMTLWSNQAAMLRMDLDPSDAEFCRKQMLRASRQHFDVFAAAINRFAQSREPERFVVLAKRLSALMEVCGDELAEQEGG